MFKIFYKEKQNWKVGGIDYYLNKAIDTPKIIILDENGNILFNSNRNQIKKVTNMKQMLFIIENCYMCKWHSIDHNDKNEFENHCSHFDWPKTKLIENPKEIPSWCELDDYRKEE